MKKISILLVEDSILFRSALTNILCQHKTFSVVACPSSRLVKRSVKFSHQAVLIDAVTWTAGGQSLPAAVQWASTAAPVILLGREDLMDRHLEALRKGAVGFVKQTESARVLIRAIKAVADGLVWFEGDLFKKVFSQSSLANTWHRELSFNSREKRIMNLVASGKTNREIGLTLGLTERTIKAYVSNLFRRIGIHNRSGLASYAILQGFTQYAQRPIT